MFDTMELSDTVDMMLSDDYKERFKAEYNQTMIRWLKLRRLLCKHNEGELNFHFSAPPELLMAQLKTMGKYLSCLRARAAYEDIDLEDVPQELLFWAAYGEIGERA